MKTIPNQLTDILKNVISSVYRKAGDSKMLILKGSKSYTGIEIADEIDNETEFGISMITGIIKLTIDLLSRDNLAINDDIIKKQIEEANNIVKNIIN